MRAYGKDNRLELLLDAVARDVESGLLPSCQVALAHRGELVAFEAFGDATTETRYTIFSATKPLVASAAWILIGEELLDIRARVADWIPEFAANGKAEVTVEQVMLHTCGFPRAVLPPERWANPDEWPTEFATWRLEAAPGTNYEYHGLSAHWVIAALIGRASGVDFRDYIAQRVTEPLGLGRVLGIPRGAQEGIAPLVTCGAPARPDELEEAWGVREFPGVDMAKAAAAGHDLSERSDLREAGIPGAGGVMRAADLAMFYQALLHNPGRIWQPEVLADATGNVRNTLPDPLSRRPANRTLGLITAGHEASLIARKEFGTENSSRAFGHPGSYGQIGWANPENSLSFAYCTNGCDLNLARPITRGNALSNLATRAVATL